MRLGRYLFPAPIAKTLVISENRMIDIMYRMALRGKATVQGFRGLASTVLNGCAALYFICFRIKLLDSENGRIEYG